MSGSGAARSVADLLCRSVAPIRNVYLHLPFCTKKCHYCAFPVHAIGEQSTHLLGQYLSAIQKQIDYSQPNAHYSQSLESLYFGGGTPSLYPPASIRQLIRRFPVDGQTEVTIQVNPTQISKIEGYLEAGVNRVSLGLQSFNQQTLRKLNRPAPEISRKELQDQLKLVRPQSLSVDFITNFCQSDSDWQEMFEFIDEVRPQHLTLYMLEVNEGSKIHQQPQKYAEFTQEGRSVERYEIVTKLFASLGYQHYEVSNFSLEQKYKSKHNACYWEGDRQFMAFGMGAASLINRHRVTRPQTLSKYMKFVNGLGQASSTEIRDMLSVSSQTQILKCIESILMSRLRTKKGIEWHRLSHVQGLKQRLCLEVRQIQQEKSGIINLTDLSSRLSLKSPAGFLLADLIAYRLIQATAQLLDNDLI